MARWWHTSVLMPQPCSHCELASGHSEGGASGSTWTGNPSCWFHTGREEMALGFDEGVVDAASSCRWEGFGVPKLISSVASLSVAVVAASGTAAIVLDGAGKVFGKRECIECLGWEGLRCTMCEGKGLVQYFVNNFEDGQGDSVQSLAAAIASGSANLGYVPASVNSALPLPRRECPTCEGTGVLTWKKCKGESLHETKNEL